MNKLILSLSPSAGMFNLRDILIVMPDNKWVWTVLEFEGVGEAPAGISMSDFQNCLWELEKGWTFSWQDLRSFADGVEQVFWCFIVAAESLENIKRPVEVDEVPQGCILGLEAFDGSEWIIWSDEQALLERFSQLSIVSCKS